MHRMLGRRRDTVDPLQKNNAIVRTGAEKIGCTVDEIGNGFLRIGYRGAVYFSRSADFSFESLMTGYICGDKETSQSILRSEGLPIPEFLCVPHNGFQDALQFFEKLDGPAVLKPAGGSGGLGISTYVRSRRELVRAFGRALAYSKGRILIERHVDGNHYRVTVLDGEIVSIVKRIPPHVVGDGETPLRLLIEMRNRKIREKTSTQIVPFPADAVTRKCIATQGFRLRSIPPPETTVFLRNVCNGGSVRDVSEMVHGSYGELAVKASECVGAKFCGVDLIATDVRERASMTNCAINEVNSTPALYIVDAPNRRKGMDIGERLARRIVGLGGPGATV